MQQGHKPAVPDLADQRVSHRTTDPRDLTVNIHFNYLYMCTMHRVYVTYGDIV